jgi:hypothetical protein
MFNEADRRIINGTKEEEKDENDDSDESEDENDTNAHAQLTQKDNKKVQKKPKKVPRKRLNVLGYNSARFDFVLLLPFLSGEKWYINNQEFIGDPAKAKQIVVSHKTKNVDLRFLDAMLYALVGRLVNFV